MQWELFIEKFNKTEPAVKLMHLESIKMNESDVGNSKDLLFSLQF